MQKSFSGWFSWLNGSKIGYKNWECPISDCSDLTGYQKIIWGDSLGYKNLSKFT